MLFEGLAVLGIVGKIMDLVWVVGEVVEFFRGFFGAEENELGFVHLAVSHHFSEGLGNRPGILVTGLHEGAVSKIITQVFIAWRDDGADAFDGVVAPVAGGGNVFSRLIILG